MRKKCHNVQLKNKIVNSIRERALFALHIASMYTKQEVTPHSIEIIVHKPLLVVYVFIMNEL